jgi:hypothetical protein
LLSGPGTGGSCLLILATQKAEIRRITAGGQSERKVKNLSQKKYQTQKKGWWSGWSACLESTRS